MLDESLETEYIEEMYDKLILLIKEKTPTINISLCSICPRGDADVDNVNSVIKDLSDFHSCVFFDINKTFYNKYDEPKSHFYKPRDFIPLSRSGTRGLLGCINQHIEIVENFKLCGYTRQSTQSRGPQMPPSQRRTKLSREGEIMLSHPETDDIDSYNSERCFKCGLTNHKTFECRHKKQVQCFICRFYGNKDSDCWN